MKKRHLIIGASVIAVTSLATIALAGRFRKDPVVCPTVDTMDDIKMTPKEFQEACADEWKANKDEYKEVTTRTNDRNNEIRQIMGWTDEDFASMGLIETK